MWEERWGKGVFAGGGGGGRGSLINFLPLITEGGHLLAGGGLFERGGFIEDLQ